MAILTLELTIVCWGSTFGVAAEAAEILTNQGTKTNVLAIRNVMPFKSDQIAAMLSSAKKTAIGGVQLHRTDGSDDQSRNRNRDQGQILEV